MISFKKKIFFGNALLLGVIVLFLFPFVSFTVNRIMKASLTHRGERLIAELKEAPNRAAMLEKMKVLNEFIFQPAGLLDEKGNLIYHSYIPLRAELNLAHEPEIEQAIRKGQGFSEHFSPYFQENFYYVALAFDVQGQTYILHLSFRAEEIDQLKQDFELGIMLIGALLLVMTSLLDTILIHYVLRPIQKIVDAIRPYKEGKEGLLPRIVLDGVEQGGEFNQLASTFNELTDRIQHQIQNLTRQREETKEILESIDEGIIAADTSGKVTFANRTAGRMLGIPSDQLMSGTLDALPSHSSDLSNKCHELILRALQTAQPIVETWVVREGGPFYLDLITAPLAHQNGALLVLQNKTSDYRIVELGKDFIANASHELRTPITIIRGFAETLQDLPNISPKMLHEITEKIVRTCERLDKLVRSLLTLSDVENLSPDRLKTANLVLVAESCTHVLLAAHPGTQLQFKSEVEAASIQADPDLLELAILNILENAVKYSQPPAKIEMLIYEREGEVHLEIRDQGIGISESDLPHIFDRFYTVDKARSRKAGGAGLGLSIVKTIVEKHKGRVSVTSELGKGSVFTLSLALR